MGLLHSLATDKIECLKEDGTTKCAAVQRLLLLCATVKWKATDRAVFVRYGDDVLFLAEGSWTGVLTALLSANN
jgi:hypothetical protein